MPNHLESQRTRLADRVLAAHVLLRIQAFKESDQEAALVVASASETLRVFQSALRERAVVLDYENVAEYFFAAQKGKPEGWSLFDFPAVMPPFPVLWLETRTPRSYLESPSVKATGATEHLRASGALLLTDDLAPVSEAGTRLQRTIASLSPSWNFCPTSRSELDFAPLSVPVANGQAQEPFAWNPDALCHLVVGLIVQEDKRGNLLFPAMFAYLVGEQGEMLSHLQCFATSREAQFAQQGKFFRDIIFAEAFPALLALSFCHCKNITLAAHEPPAKLARAWQKRRGTPMLSFKTLEIGGVTKTLRDEGRVEENGLKKALHLVRGHFATYTPEKPLFGKLTGKFWVPAHARGDATLGEVRKDYRLKAQGRSVG